MPRRANNFRNSTTKRTYLYLLTPKGIDEKAKVTLRFLKSKLAEYESIKTELEELQRDATKERVVDANRKPAATSSGNKGVR